METYSAFTGDDLVVRGDLATVVGALGDRGAHVLILDDATGRAIDLDRRAPLTDEASAPKPARGRPRLGVVPREVTLLPRHWEWLSTQSGGASAALRRLVDQARRESAGEDDRRQIQEAVYRVATTLAGDRPGYEEAIRALFAGDLAAFRERIAAWPPDIAAYLRDLTARLGEPQ
jgi:hypothetical protein